MSLISIIQPDDEDFKEYTFKINEFLSLIKVQDQSKYTTLPLLIKGLQRKLIELKTEEEITTISWLSMSKINKKTGSITIRFDKELKSYLLNLKSFYTQYRLSNVLSMKSKYSIRLYELIKSHDFKAQKEFTISLEELKSLFKLESKYFLYADFKRKVLLKAQMELKKYSDTRFDFEEEKKGRKVESITFSIYSNKKNIKDNQQQIKNIKNIENVELEIKSELEILKLKVGSRLAHLKNINLMSEFANVNTKEEVEYFIKKYNLKID